MSEITVRALTSDHFIEILQHLFLSDAISFAKALPNEVKLHLISGRYARWRKRWVELRSAIRKYETLCSQGPATRKPNGFRSTADIAKNLHLESPELNLIQVYKSRLEELGMSEAPLSLSQLALLPCINDFTTTNADDNTSSIGDSIIRPYLVDLSLGRSTPMDAFRLMECGNATDLICLIRIFIALIRISRGAEANTALYQVSHEAAFPLGQQEVHLDSECQAALSDFFSLPRLSVPDGETGVSLTAEQRAFVEYDVEPGELVKVQAFAGTGKTFSLRAYAQRRTDQNFLYTVFNKSLEQSAITSFATPIGVAMPKMQPPPFEYSFNSNPPTPTVSRNNSGIPSTPTKRYSHSQYGQYTPSRSGSHSLPSTPRRGVGATGSNVRCQTLHSIAYRHMAPSMLSGRKLGTLLAWAVAKSFGPLLPTGKSLTSKKRGNITTNSAATWVIKTLNRFMSSADREVTEAHVPAFAMKQKTDMQPKAVAAAAQQLWKWIVAGKDDRGQPIVLPHDAYVKQLQLNLSRFPDFLDDYDAILLDEAQDISDCQASIFLDGAKNSAKIIVGDAFQRLYAFRGASGRPFDDQRYPPSRSFTFTYSFRFGDRIARAATLLLSVKAPPPEVCATKRPRIKGLDTINDVVGRHTDEAGAASLSYDASTGLFKNVQPHTRLYRTNAALTRDALVFGIRLPLSARIYLRTNAALSSNNLIALLIEAHGLYHGTLGPQWSQDSLGRQKKREGVLGDFKDWQALKEHVSADDEDVNPMVALVVSLESLLEGDDFLDTVDQLENRFCQTEAEATVIMSTVHQAKGLEWDRVYLAHDLGPRLVPRPNSVSLDIPSYLQYMQDELMCTYVALTRARKEVLLSPTVAHRIAAIAGVSQFRMTGQPALCPCCSRTDEILVQRCHRLPRRHFINGNEDKDSNRIKRAAARARLQRTAKVERAMSEISVSGKLPLQGSPEVIEISSDEDEDEDGDRTVAQGVKQEMNLETMEFSSDSEDSADWRRAARRPNGSSRKRARDEAEIISLIDSDESDSEDDDEDLYGAVDAYEVETLGCCACAIKSRPLHSRPDDLLSFVKSSRASLGLPPIEIAEAPPSSPPAGAVPGRAPRPGTTNAERISALPFVTCSSRQQQWVSMHNSAIENSKCWLEAADRGRIASQQNEGEGDSEDEVQASAQAGLAGGNQSQTFVFSTP